MFSSALLTPKPLCLFKSLSLNSIASCFPVEAPEGTAALPKELSEKIISHSTVVLPRLSIISLAFISFQIFIS